MPNNVSFAYARLRERIFWCHIKKCTPRVDQILNRKHNLNETKNQLSSKKINLSKKTQHPFNLKRNISHQESVTPAKYQRRENITDPVDNKQVWNHIEKHESQYQALIKFSQNNNVNHGVIMNN